MADAAIAEVRICGFACALVDESHSEGAGAIGGTSEQAASARGYAAAVGCVAHCKSVDA
jgi:hypothetical protein